VVVEVGLVFAAHGLEVAADGPQLHRRVLRPGVNVIIAIFAAIFNIQLIVMIIIEAKLF
jgi:hypothetical protein